MIYQVRLLKGLLHPQELFFQLHKAEVIKGLKPRIFLLFVFSIIIYAMSAFYGMGTESISKELAELPRSEFETRKLLFMLGKIAWAILYTAIILFVPAAFFWVFTDLPFNKVVVIQLIAACLLLLEKALVFLVASIWGLNRFSSPFSLGVVSQYVIEYEFLIYFFSFISIFSVWTIYFQYNGIKKISNKEPKMVALMVVGINLIFWLIASLFSIIKFEKLL
ncbi:hypothetical protein LS684_18770 [Cytobacillus spongiae]|uniref:hypothetical protein n=1 Tax=Cytobacillus spongiae TaxID=2901381 RepID=UPI001F41643D|nr:hypothetical protein [Cytobacillus spongiae]UII55644.1 hypothetical protein LS684_18770 [Cytobacillus spongiae]